MPRTLALLAAVLASTLAPMAHAQSTHDVSVALRSEARETAATDRMVVGLATGRIDARESARLADLLRRVRDYQDAVYADGVVSRRERVRLDHLQDRLDRAIARATRD